MKEAGVKGFEDLLEIIVVAAGGEDALAATDLTNVFGLPGHSFRGDVAPVSVSMCGCDGLLIKLGEQDVGNSAEDGLGSVLKKVGEADVELAFAEANGRIEGGESAEADVK